MKRRFVHNWPTLFWAMVVFVMAILFRLPSCYESFWLDELHTAWTICDRFGDVTQRAAIGNQTPIYFRIMWIWQSVFGDSEIALRMSSVLAVALSSALLVVGIKQTTQRLSAGVFAGGILALESSSVFFGTEFRPYAFVILMSTIAIWAAMLMLSRTLEQSNGNLRLVFVVTVTLAALFHPTSVVTMGVLACALLMIRILRDGVSLRIQIADIISMTLIVAAAISLTDTSLPQSWENRSQWGAFGTVRSVWEFWAMWPWIPIAIVPVGLAVLMCWRVSWRIVGLAVLPLVVGLVAMSVFFVASYNDWVPLWHRRYFVAVLPMLAWSAGTCLATLPIVSVRKMDLIGTLVATTLVCGMFVQQGSWNWFRVTSTWIEPRSEDWRGAVAWVNDKRHEDERINVSSGLIEANSWLTAAFGGAIQEMVIGPDENRYLTFPVRGPYFLEGATHLDLRPDHFVFYALTGGRPHAGTGWVISRSNDRLATEWVEKEMATLLDAKQFGRICVLHYRNRPSS